MSFYPKPNHNKVDRWLKLVELMGGIGTQEETSDFQRRNKKFVNYTILLYIFALNGFGFYYISMNSKMLMPVILLAFGFIPPLIGCLVLNARRNNLAACLLSNLLFTAALFIPLAFYLGRRMGIHYYFLLLALLPVLSLKPKQLYYIIPLSGLNIAAYYWIEYKRPFFDDISYYLQIHSVENLKNMSLLTSIIFVMIMIWINQRVLLSNEHTLTTKTTKLKVALEHLRELATIDQLTGLFNRTYFDIRVMNEMARAKRYDTPLTLIMFDLDYFKGINDTFGHDVGDEVLRHAARVCNESIRESDILARWGGEEFVVLAPQTDLDGAEKLAEKLRSVLEKSHVEPFGVVTGSFGVTAYTNNESFETWYKRTDKAMYLAKTSGRNCVKTLIE